MAVVIGLAESDAGFDAAAGQPHHDAAAVVVAAVVGDLEAPLRVNRATVDAAPVSPRLFRRELRRAAVSRSAMPR